VLQVASADRVTLAWCGQTFLSVSQHAPQRSAPSVYRFVVNTHTHTPFRRLGMARVIKESHSFTCTPRVHPLTEWTIPAFAFPAEAGPHLPTLVGWKAKLAWVACYIPR